MSDFDVAIFRLNEFGKSLRQVAANNELTRLHANKERGEPAIFIPDIERGFPSDTFGIGYWLHDGWVIGIRRNSNGYELYPCFSMDQEFLKKLAAL